MLLFYQNLPDAKNGKASDRNNHMKCNKRCNFCRQLKWRHFTVMCKPAFGCEVYLCCSCSERTFDVYLNFVWPGMKDRVSKLYEVAMDHIWMLYMQLTWKRGEKFFYELILSDPCRNLKEKSMRQPAYLHYNSE